MPIMKKEEIINLAKLSRIKLTETEVEALESELSSIVEYVSVVSDIAAGEADTAPVLGARYNVLRKDETTNEPDQYTNDLLAEMPATEGRHMLVKKILKNEE